jgi:hypothetical protein
VSAYQKLPAELAKVPRLRLQIDPGDTADLTLSSWLRFRNLDALSINSASLGAIDLHGVSAFKQLKALQVSRLDISPQSLDEVAQLTNLETLGLTGARNSFPTDIAKMIHLKSVDITLDCSKRGYPENELLKLEDLPLQELTITENYCYTFINPDVIAQLLPHVTIHLDVYSGADLERRPDILALVEENTRLLGEITTILDGEPDMGLSVRDVILDEARKGAITQEAQVEYRTALVKYLRGKIASPNSNKESKE